MFLCLDEVANIAPIHDLPAHVSEAGGQHLHVMACLQDLSQARNRWGDAAADGFLSLFQTKLILTGIADSRTTGSDLPRARRIRPPAHLPHARTQPQRGDLRSPRHQLRECHLPHPAPPHAAARRDRPATQRTRAPPPRHQLGAPPAHALVPDTALAGRRGDGGEPGILRSTISSVTSLAGCETRPCAGSQRFYGRQSRGRCISPL